MAKNLLHSVQRKKPMKRKKNNWVNKVIDYLKNDSYMFAPLVSPPPSDFHQPDEGVEIKEPCGEKNQRLMKKILEFLKADSYMYASLCLPPQSVFVPPKESSKYVKRVTWEVSTTTSNIRGSEQGEKLRNVRTGDKISKAHRPETISFLINKA